MAVFSGGGAIFIVMTHELFSDGGDHVDDDDDNGGSAKESGAAKAESLASCSISRQIPCEMRRTGESDDETIRVRGL